MAAFTLRFFKETKQYQERSSKCCHSSVLVNLLKLKREQGLITATKSTETRVIV